MKYAPNLKDKLFYNKWNQEIPEYSDFVFLVLITTIVKLSSHVGILFLRLAHCHLVWSRHHSDGSGLN